MPVKVNKSKATIEEYFAYEASIEGYAEYYDGVIIDRYDDTEPVDDQLLDIAQETENHSLISINLTIAIGNKLKGGDCRLYNKDFRLAIQSANTFLRPDLWVICGPTEKYSERKDAAKNALMVAEVLSESTSSYDRGGKFTRYRMIPSLREYVLIEQDLPQVDIFFLNDSGIWEFRYVTDLESEVKFQSLKISVAMKDIYANVVFP